MYRAGNERTGNSIFNIPAAAGVELKEATMMAINASGYAEPASAKEGITIAGCVQKYSDNRLGKDGDIQVNVKRGTYVWNNDGTIQDTDILKECYVKDETTVTITAAGSSRAGIILAVESDGVVVDMAQNRVLAVNETAEENKGE